MNKDDSQDLMIKLIELRNQFNETKSKEDEKLYRAHEKLCIEQFKYLILMRTNRYRNFSNYEDLQQEGYEALLKAMKNYNPKKGSWFWWAHKYIDTKIARMANLHTTIRYPLKYAKNNVPHKEAKLPMLIESEKIPEREYENFQTEHLIQSVMATSLLNDQSKTILNMAYGLDGNKPMSINKICLTLGITRTVCKNLINDALRTLVKNIQL